MSMITLIRDSWPYSYIALLVLILFISVQIHIYFIKREAWTGIERLKARVADLDNRKIKHRIDTRYLDVANDYFGKGYFNNQLAIESVQQGNGEIEKVEESHRKITSTRRIIDSVDTKLFLPNTDDIENAERAFEDYDYELAMGYASRADDIIKKVISTMKRIQEANRKYDKAIEEGFIYPDNELERAWKELSLYNYDDARKIADEVFVNADEHIRANRQTLEGLSQYREELRNLADDIDINSFDSLTKRVEVTLRQKDPKRALRKLGEAKASLKQARINWEPDIFLSFPTEVAGGGYEPIKISIQNNGNARAKNIGLRIEIDGRDETQEIIKDYFNRGDHQIIESTLYFKRFGEVPIFVSLTYHRAHDNASFTKTHRTTLYVRKKVEIEHSSSIVDGLLKVSIVITNQFGDNMYNTRFKHFFNEKKMMIERIEPADVSLLDNEFYFGDIKCRDYQSIDFYFTPMVSQGIRFQGYLSYNDILNEKRHYKVAEEFTISTPIIETEERPPPPSELQNVISSVQSKGSRLFQIPRGMRLDKAFRVSRATLTDNRNLRFVREYKSRDPYRAEAWYYGQLEKTHQIVVSFSVIEERYNNLIWLFAAADDSNAVAGLLLKWHEELIDMNLGFKLFDHRDHDKILTSILNSKLLDNL